MQLKLPGDSLILLRSALMLFSEWSKQLLRLTFPLCQDNTVSSILHIVLGITSFSLSNQWEQKPFLTLAALGDGSPCSFWALLPGHSLLLGVCGTEAGARGGPSTDLGSSRPCGALFSGTCELWPAGFSFPVPQAQLQVSVFIFSFSGITSPSCLISECLETPFSCIYLVF